MNMYVFEISYKVKDGKITQYGKAQTTALNSSIAKSNVQRDLDHTYGIGVAKVTGAWNKGRA